MKIEPAVLVVLVAEGEPEVVEKLVEMVVQSPEIGG
jgi:hypothetical protein